MMKPTIYIDQTSAMANQSIGGLKQIIETNAQSNFLNDLQAKEISGIFLSSGYKIQAHFVGIFLVDVILNSYRAELGKVFWPDLDKIGDCSLKSCQYNGQTFCKY